MSQDSIVGWGWSGIAPIAMSLLVLLMLIAGDALFGVNPLPIHDEDAADHIGMNLMLVPQGSTETNRLLPQQLEQLPIYAE